MRKTVIVRRLGEEPRYFHLEENKAQRFAAHIRATGGTAEIGPFRMDASLRSVFERAGVKPEDIR